MFQRRLHGCACVCALVSVRRYASGRGGVFADSASCKTGHAVLSPAAPTALHQHLTSSRRHAARTSPREPTVTASSTSASALLTCGSSGSAATAADATLRPGPGSSMHACAHAARGERAAACAAWPYRRQLAPPCAPSRQPRCLVPAPTERPTRHSASSARAGRQCGRLARASRAMTATAGCPCLYAWANTPRLLRATRLFNF